MIPDSGSGLSAQWMSRREWLIVAVILAAGSLVKVYTGFVWEDFLITFRFCENWASGKGMVYQVGEKVFGFTSPLNGVLPALFKRFIGGEGFGVALWGFTLVSLLVWGFGLSRAARLSTHRFQTVLLVAFSILQAKLTIFTISGQEAGLWAGFLLLSLYAESIESTALLGISWGGLLWTRPDSPVQILLLAIAALWLSTDSRVRTLRRLTGAGAVAAIIYAPWVVVTTWYYGSPIPHTIIAKQNMLGVLGPKDRFVRFLENLQNSIPGAFEGIYSQAGGWPPVIGVIAAVLGLVCAGYWILPRGNRIVRIASIIFMGSALYLGWVGAMGLIFPWYFSPLNATAAFILAYLFSRGITLVGTKRSFALAALAIVTLELSYVSLFTVIQVKVRQHYVEEGVRTELGNWLRAHSAPADTVFLEPIGYIGYYSRLHILDYPGLNTPEVVKLRKRPGMGFFGCAIILNPNWIVLRKQEAHLLAEYPQLVGRYTAVEEFDGFASLRPFLDLPGSGFLSSDSGFVIFHRNSKR